MPRVRDGLVRLKPGGAFGSHVFKGTKRPTRTLDRPDGSHVALGAALAKLAFARCLTYRLQTAQRAEGLVGHPD